MPGIEKRTSQMKFKRFLPMAALSLMMSAITAQAAVPIPYVTFDISGTYPANSTNSQLTNPNTSFLLEFTVKQVVPAYPEPFYFQTPVLNASYSFEGVTHYATTTGSFVRSASGGNAEGIALTFNTDTFVLSTTGPTHSPFLSTGLGSGSNAEFLVGNLGPGTNWYVDGRPVSVNEVVSRLIGSSPNNTVVTTVGPTITDATGSVWAITAAAQVTLNGNVISYTSGVVEIAYVNGVVWQRNNAGNWYSFNANGSLGIGPTKTSPLH
jgi:hypothetical protein